MHVQGTLLLAALLLVTISHGSAAAQEENKFPAPRFLAYLKPPNRSTTLCPLPAAAVRQTGGRTPLGLVGKGRATLIVTEVRADPMVMQAIKRAYEERGVKVYLTSEDELLGIAKEEAVKAIIRETGRS
jgi:hypothetical protein